MSESTDLPGSASSSGRPRVVVVGGGFAGLEAVKQLRRAPCDVVLIDRRNHFLFQPLLYQVATAALSPAQISAPLRRIFRRYKNTRVRLGEVTGIDTADRSVSLADGGVERYDYLVVAAGQETSYFGHDEWVGLAPGLKSNEDAIDIRGRFLSAFEEAELEADAAERRRLLTFVVVGGGPTGVEMAGTFAEMARKSMPRDFRSIDTRTARVVLVEGQDRVLPAFPEACSPPAKRQLERLGVEVMLNVMVTRVDDRGVEWKRAGEQDSAGSDEASGRIEEAVVVWAAGLKGAPVAGTLEASTDKGGRVRVAPDLSLPGHPEVFVVGDLAFIRSPGDEPVPGVAPAAMQMGRHAGRLIAAAARAGVPASGEDRPKFTYKDKGSLATIGRGKAVGQVAGITVSGAVAWLAWAGVHIVYLINFRRRLQVMIEWAWMYLAFERGARIITRRRDHDA